MASNIQPPPTWAPVSNPDGSFNPVWLQWFLQLAAIINQNAGGTTGIQHNSLQGLQGGSSGQFYHLDNAGYNSIYATGSMARQVDTSITVLGGTIDGTTIGGTTPAAVTGTTITGTAVNTGTFSATGTVKFGTYTAGVIAQTGSVTITDSGGTTRRLLVG